MDLRPPFAVEAHKRRHYGVRVDRLTKERRSWLMSRISSKNTKPELLVRSFLHRLGFRFRLHRKELPGRPDIVFPARRKAIFVHGCFWHGHYCKATKMPKSRVAFWDAKIAGNRKRDIRARRRLKALGWHSLVIWECDLKRPEKLRAKLLRFLSQE